MIFQNLLAEYEDKLAYIKRMVQPNTLSFSHKTKEYWMGYLRCAFDWFQQLKLECTDFNPVIRNATEQENIDFNMGDYPLHGVLEYRGQKIPVYFDDYGQQLFITYAGNETNGGAYNTMCEYDFCYFIDQILDLNILNVVREG